MIGILSRRRLMGVAFPVILLGALSLAACSVNPLGSNPSQSHPLTVAAILQNATNVLNVHATKAPSGSNSATVTDLTYTMTFDISLTMSSSASGSSSTESQSLDETMSATGKETLSPRREQMNMTMAILGENITMAAIVDEATQTCYIQMSRATPLPGTKPGTWYSMSFASLGGLGADTSMYIDYSKLKNAKLIGGETINGVPVWHVQASENLDQSLSGLGGGTTGATTSTTGGSSAMTATINYYFRQDNYRPVKVVIASTDALSTLGSMTMKGEMDFTSFNTGISIALPPASDVQPLQGLPGLGS